MKLTDRDGTPTAEGVKAMFDGLDRARMSAEEREAADVERLDRLTTQREEALWVAREALTALAALCGPVPKAWVEAMERRLEREDLS